jgi:hypothetical protein
MAAMGLKNHFFTLICKALNFIDFAKYSGFDAFSTFFVDVSGSPRRCRAS